MIRNQRDSQIHSHDTFCEKRSLVWNQVNFLVHLISFLKVFGHFYNRLCRLLHATLQRLVN